MADLGGMPGTFLHFDIQNFRNITALGVHTSPTRSIPAYWKSWICHWLVFHINERPILIMCLNLKLVQIGRKAPSFFLTFGEILGSYHVTWHNFAPHGQWLLVGLSAEKCPPWTVTSGGIVSWKVPPVDSDISWDCQPKPPCGQWHLVGLLAEKPPFGQWHLVGLSAKKAPMDSDIWWDCQPKCPHVDSDTWWDCWPKCPPVPSDIWWDCQPESTPWKVTSGEIVSQDEGPHARYGNHFIGSFKEIPLLEASPISENLVMCIFTKLHAFSSNLHKMHAFSSNLHKMCTFSVKCMHFHQISIKCMHFTRKCVHFWKALTR